MASRPVLRVGLSPLFRSSLQSGTWRISRAFQKVHSSQDSYHSLSSSYTSTRPPFSELIRRCEIKCSSIRQILPLDAFGTKTCSGLSWFKTRSEIRHAIRNTYYQSGGSRRGGGGLGYPGESGRNPFKGFLSSIPSNWIFYGILGINVLVYGAWGWAQNYWVRSFWFSAFDPCMQ